MTATVHTHQLMLNVHEEPSCVAILPLEHAMLSFTYPDHLIIREVSDEWYPL